MRNKRMPAEPWAQGWSHSKHAIYQMLFFLAALWVQDALILGIPLQREPRLTPPAEIALSHIRARLSTHHPPTPSHHIWAAWMPRKHQWMEHPLRSTWGCFCWNAKTDIPAGLIWHEHNVPFKDYVDRSLSPPDAFRSTMWIPKLSVFIMHYNPVL